jgi:hypothetical protein
MSQAARGPMTLLRHLVDEIMNKRSWFRPLRALSLSLMLAERRLRRTRPQRKHWWVNGHTSDAAVVQIDGHSGHSRQKVCDCNQ